MIKCSNQNQIALKASDEVTDTLFETAGATSLSTTWPRIILQKDNEKVIEGTSKLIVSSKKDILFDVLAIYHGLGGSTTRQFDFRLGVGEARPSLLWERECISKRHSQTGYR